MSFFFHVYCVMSMCLAWGQVRTKFRGVMSAQNTHHILVFYHVFGSFY